MDYSNISGVMRLLREVVLAGKRLTALRFRLRTKPENWAGAVRLSTAINELSTLRPKSNNLSSRCHLTFLTIIMFCCGFGEAFADQFFAVRSINGKNVYLKSEGDQPRAKPDNVIVVCSDGAHDDVAKLGFVASKFFSNENYTIVNGNNLPKGFDSKSATFVFFGSGDEESTTTSCVQAVPGFVEYIKLQRRLLQSQSEELDAKLKIQFGSSQNVLAGGYCAPEGPTSKIDGVTFHWSVQLRAPVTEACLRSYWAVFGIDRLCLTEICKADEEQSIFDELK